VSAIVRAAPRKQAKLDADLARLAALSSAELGSEWQEHFATAPPKIAPALLRRLLTQRLQEQRLGGLPSAVARELERVAAGPTAQVAPAPTSAHTPGTRFIREWQGRTIAVQATDNGFVWEHRTYRSLSQIAKEVTGAHWSGPRFFGLKRRG
jgi:hypothetical protein